MPRSSRQAFLGHLEKIFRLTLALNSVEGVFHLFLAFHIKLLPARQWRANSCCDLRVDRIKLDDLCREEGVTLAVCSMKFAMVCRRERTQ